MGSVLQLCNGAAARARAFERYGVVVKFPALSRSGGIVIRRSCAAGAEVAA